MCQVNPPASPRGPREPMPSDAEMEALARATGIPLWAVKLDCLIHYRRMEAANV